MKLSPKTSELTPFPAPESTAELVAILDAWEPNCPDAGRAAQFLRRKSPGRPVVYRDKDKAIEAFQIQLRRSFSRWSACMCVANSIVGFHTEPKPESVARRLSDKLAAMEADPGGRKILDEARRKFLDEMVLSNPRRK